MAWPGTSSLAHHFQWCLALSFSLCFIHFTERVCTMHQSNSHAPASRPRIPTEKELRVLSKHPQDMTGSDRKALHRLADMAEQLEQAMQVGANEPAAATVRRDISTTKDAAEGSAARVKDDQEKHLDSSFTPDQSSFHPENELRLQTTNT